MCDENITEILSVDFADGDGANWTTNSTNPIQTIDSKLLLNPSTKNSYFLRQLGSLTADILKTRIKLNLEIFRPIQGGSKGVNYYFQLFIGSIKIVEYNLSDLSLKPGEAGKYFLDRTADLPTTAGTLYLKILTPVGFENSIRLTNLEVTQFNFCYENVRSYFVIDELLSLSRDSVSTAILVNQFLVDGLETLTIDFRDYNTKKLGNNPTADWYLSRAELDGTGRAANVPAANSFNPFIKELGLLFDPTNYYSGLPTGTINGKNFGAAIMKLGIDKPVILNADAVAKDGAFFLDLDYSKNFHLSFDVAINNTSANAFNKPTIYRSYTLSWNYDKKEKIFQYTERNTGNVSNELKNGFLTGQTGFEIVGANIPTATGVNFGSDVLPYPLIVNIEPGDGVTGIEYEIQDKPVKIDIEYDNERFSTGYVGNAQYDQKLLNLGVLQSEIKTVNSDNYKGQLKFSKLAANPTTFKVIISAPIDNTKGYFTEKTTNYIELFLGEGSCGDEITFDKLGYVPFADLKSFDITDDDHIYSDTANTIDFNGDDKIYKIYFYNKNGRNEIKKTFKISSSGIVSETTICNL